MARFSANLAQTDLTDCLSIFIHTGIKNCSTLTFYGAIVENILEPTFSRQNVYPTQRNTN